MRTDFNAIDLADRDMARAVPLLQTTWPDVDRDAWRDFVSAFRRGNSTDMPAIVGLFDGSGALCGLFAARVEHSLRDGRILAVPLFTVVDVSNSMAPARVLVDAVVARAAAQRCRGLQLHLANEQNALVKRLSGLGLQRSAVLHSLQLTLH